MLSLFAPILLAALLIVAGMGLTWRYGRRRQVEAADAICAACGAPAESLTSTCECTGCGRDVRLAGLVPSNVRRRGWLHPVVWVTLWGAAVTIATSMYVTTGEV